MLTLLLWLVYGVVAMMALGTVLSIAYLVVVLCVIRTYH